MLTELTLSLDESRESQESVSNNNDKKKTLPSYAEAKRHRQATISEKVNTSTRDENGLTERMREVIPIIARARTKHQGVVQCIELGILASENSYYRNFATDDHYVKAQNAERTRIMGERIERAIQIIEHYDDALVRTLVKRALSKKHKDAQRALETALHMGGHDIGRSSNFHIETHVNADTTTQAHQEDYSDWLRSRAKQRLGKLEPSKN